MAKRKQKKVNPHQRQAWGTFLLAVAILLFFALASFDVNDPVNLEAGGGVMVSNWLGLFGASLSYYLMQWTLGYPILVLPILLFLMAVKGIKNEPFTSLRRPALFLVLWAVMISVYLAIPEALNGKGVVHEYYPSGLIGGWLASKMVLFLGSFGSVATLVLLSMVLAIITVRIDPGRLFSALGQAFTVFRQRLNAAAQNYRIRREQKREEKKRKKELRRQEKEEQKQKRGEEKIAEETIEPEIPDPLPEKPPAPEIRIEQPPAKPAPAPPISDKKTVAEQPTANPVNAEGMIQTTLDDLLEDMDEQSHKKDVDFEVEEAVRDKELDYDQLVRESVARFKFPSIDLLHDPQTQEQHVSREELKSNAELLEMKLRDYGVEARVVKVTAGPVITLYELQPARGVKVSSIVNLANDLALAMEARGIRIIAPIPGKAAVGIEIPNRNPQTVYLKSLIRTEKFSNSEYELPLAVGKTINGEAYIADLAKMPHLLIAGATGAGKSVGINTIIMSLLYAVDPGKVKFMMVDPKKLELSIYRPLRDHYLLWRSDLDEEVITKPNNAVSMLNSVVLEMERRYDLLSDLGVRGIIEYNKKVTASGGVFGQKKIQRLPYIVVIIDELADLMMVAAKEIEMPIARLAQMARAVGIHLIVATQRPSVDVITGLIKANFPARIAYLVASKVDSRTILDINGAEQLLGNGDMLFLPPGHPKPIRLQNSFVTTDEVEAVINHISRQPKLPHYSLPQPKSSASGASFDSGTDGGRDPLYEDARAIVVRHQQGSISFLQRRLKIGYSRAARLMDELEEDGVVGPADGSKPREVLITLQELGE